MQKSTLPALVSLCVLAGGIFLLNDIALADFFYWKYWWYDIMMHSLGGLFVGGAVAWFFVRTGYAQKLSTKNFLLLTVALVFAVGAGWEIFEYTNGFFLGEVNVALDTMGDLLCDVLGGFVGWYILYRTFIMHHAL